MFRSYGGNFSRIETTGGLALPASCLFSFFIFGDAPEGDMLNIIFTWPKQEAWHNTGCVIVSHTEKGLEHIGLHYTERSLSPITPPAY